MNLIRIVLIVLMLQSLPTFAQSECEWWINRLKPHCIGKRWHQIWHEGDNTLYFTGYAWHNRHTYTKDKLKSYNEAAWGGGLGKTYYDVQGDEHGLYAFAFLDSHKNVEPIAGYVFFKMLRLEEHTKAGAGVTLFVTARPDIFHGIPFPGALPAVALTHRRASLNALYIPGAKGAGNVLFLLAKYRL